MGEDDNGELRPPLRRRSLVFISSSKGLAVAPRAVPALPEEEPDLAGQMAAEREAAPALWAELQAAHPLRRGLLVQKERRFQTWGLFDLLLRLSREGAAGDPAASSTLAELALLVLGELGPRLSAGLAGQYRASALVALAESSRRLGRLESAHETLAEAGEILRAGTQDLFVTSQILSARARLAEDLGYLTEAAQAFGDAARLLERLSNLRAAARLRLEQAGALGPAAPDEAVALILRAFPHLDFEQDTRLELVAHHRLIWSTNDAGRPWEAGELFDAAQPVYQGQRTALVRVHRLWLEGRILRNSGDLDPARMTLLRAYYALAEMGHLQDLVLCGLDLVELYRLCREPRRTERLVADLAADLMEAGFHADALAAWRRALDLSERSEFAELALLFRESWYRFTAAAEPGE